MAEKLKISVHVDPKVNKEELRSTIIAAAKNMKAVEINIKPAIKMNHLHATLQREFNKLPPVQIRVAPSVSTELQTAITTAVSNAVSNIRATAKSGTHSTSSAINSSSTAARQNTEALALREDVRKANLSRQILSYIDNNRKIKNNPFAAGTLTDIQESLNLNTISVDAANAKFAQLRNHFKQAKLETASLSASIGKLFKDHLGTQAVLLGINAIRKSFIQMINDVVALDVAMTELKKVTDETDHVYMEFLDRATEKAQRLGATISDVVTATADFARLGYSIGDAEQLAEAAIVYKNVGDGIEDISVASSSIISTMKAFGIEASEAMSIVDKFNLTGNKFAISSSGVGEALSRSAAGLAETNNSLSESIALITAANTVVQNPEVVGNALKTLSLRITKTSTELEAMGEDASYAYESTADYRKEVLAITGAYGKQIDLLDETTGAYKSTYQILKELSAVWDDIDDSGKQSLLYTLGGARQVNVLSAILKNFDDAEKVVEELSNAQGSALAENEKYLDSIMGKWSQVQASFQDISDTVIDNDFVKMMLDVANVSLKAADGIMELTGALPLLASAFTAYAMSTGGKKFLLYNGAFSLSNMMMPLDPNSKKGSSIFNIPSHFNTNKNRLINDAAILGRASAGISGSISSSAGMQRAIDYIDHINAQYGQMSKINQQILMSRLATAKTEKECLSIINKSSKELSGAAKAAKSFGQTFMGVIKGMAVAMAINLVISGITKAFDAAITTVEEHNEKIAEYTDKITTATDELTKLRELQASGTGITDADKQRLDYLEKYINSLSTVRKLEEIERNEKDLLTNGSINPFEEKTNKEIRDKLLLQAGADERSIATGKAATLRVEMNAAANLEDASDKQKQKAAAKIAALEAEVINEYQALKETEVGLLQQQELLEGAISLITEDDELYDDYLKELDTVKSALRGLERDLDNIERQGVLPSDVFVPNGPQTDYNKIDTWNLFDNYNSKTITQTENGKEIVRTVKLNVEGADKAENLQQILKDVQAMSFDQLNKEVDGMQSAFSTLATASQEYEKTGAYTVDTLQALTQIDGRYLDMLIDEEGQINLNEEAMRALATARVEEMRIKILQNAINQIQSLTNEAAALEVVEQAEYDTATATRENTEALLENTAAEMMRQAALNGFSGVQQDAINIIIDRTNALLKSINITNLFGDSTDKAREATDKLNDALKDQGNLILKALDNRKKPLEDEIDTIEDKQDALRDELDALNDIYEAEDKEFELQKRKDAYERAKANKTVRLYTHDKGWQWVADPSEIKEAEDAYNEYLKEMERNDAKKAIEDQIDALDKAKEAIQDEIEAIDDLKDKVNDAMDNIGKTYEEHQAELAMMAEFEGMTYDELAGAVADYANTVIDSYNTMATSAANYYKTIKEEATKAAKVDHVSNIYETGDKYHSGSYYAAKDKQLLAIAAADKAIDDAKRQAQAEAAAAAAAHTRYHTGGFVKGISSTANVSPAFRQYMSNLERNEVPAILEAGEFVLTKNHQKAILDNNTALVNSSSSARNISLEIGDVIVQNPVGNVETLSTAIIRQLPNQILRDLYNK